MSSAVYVGQLWEGGTCLARARALQSLGVQLSLFDVTPYQSAGPRLVRALHHRLLAGPALSRLNRDLLTHIRQAGRVDMLWVDKGTWVFPATLQEARNMGIRCLVHYTPDPAFHVHSSRHFERSVPLYDLCVTTKRYELELYRRAGARRVLFCWQGVDQRFERIAACADIASARRHGLIFIGHCEPHYRRTLEAPAAACLPLRIHGPHWPQKLHGRQPFRTALIGGPVMADAYAATLATARIGIGLLSKLYPDAFTTRTFEIPAAGAMLLAEDTEEHRELFRAGEEADFFTCREELVDKASFYLSRDELRQAIAQRGRAIVMQRFTWRQLLQPVCRQVAELLS